MTLSSSRKRRPFRYLKLWQDDVEVARLLRSEFKENQTLGSQFYYPLSGMCCTCARFFVCFEMRSKTFDVHTTDLRAIIRVVATPKAVKSARVSHTLLCLALGGSSSDATRVAETPYAPARSLPCFPPAL